MNQTAQGLAALGRGPDTQLVHMTGGEVAGLQSLAKAHGGSLTINPETGLPEAGFLSSILPMVIGAGLMAATGGAAAPLVAGMSNAAVIGMGVGGLQTLRTGSLSKGLMAGLGAYGGAGVAGGFMDAGTGALSSAAGAGAELPVGAIVPEAVAPVADVAAAAPPTGLQQLSGVPGKTVTGMLPQPMVTPPPAAFAAQGVETVTPMYAPAESMGSALARDQAAAQAVGSKLASTTPMQTMGAGFQSATASPSAAFEFAKANKYPLGALGISALGSMEPDALNAPEQSKGMIRPYTYSREKVPGAFQDVAGAPLASTERRYFTDKFTAGTPYAAPGPEYMADGGEVNGAELESAANARNMQGGIMVPYMDSSYAQGGGISSLGDYSDGGRLLRGPGDGVSDSIPAMIGQKQQARLADGEFVVPARIVSELGNGSTEAGARQLYAMMDRVQKNRKKTMGKDKVAADSKSPRLLPA